MKITREGKIRPEGSRTTIDFQLRTEESIGIIGHCWDKERQSFCFNDSGPSFETDYEYNFLVQLSLEDIKYILLSIQEASIYNDLIEESDSERQSRLAFLNKLSDTIQSMADVIKTYMQELNSLIDTNA